MAKQLPDLKYVFNLPPEKAIEYFKSKGYAFSWDWQDLWQDAHAKAFTVAKVMRMDILQDIRGMVQKALDEGITFQQFKKELEPKLRAKGWWGKKLIGGDIPTGPGGKGGVSPLPLKGGKVVQLGSPYRLQTIYRANTQSAYMVGRYKAMVENVDDRPFWQYVAVLDRRTRPAHRILNGKVFRSDDPFWDTHYPPNGWSCRCRVRALSAGNITKRGLKPESAKGHLKTEMVNINNAGDKRPVTVYTDPKTGLTMHPDPGWCYNPGKQAFGPVTPYPLDGSLTAVTTRPAGASALNKRPVEDLPVKTLAKDSLLPPHQTSGWTEEQYISAFLHEFGASMEKPVVFKDVVNEPVVISAELFRDRPGRGYKVLKADREIYLKLLADTIKDPSEIWLAWVKTPEGKVRLCRRYIGLYKAGARKIGGYAVFDLMDDFWQGTTAFKPGNLSYLDRQRVGSLLYRKK